MQRELTTVINNLNYAACPALLPAARRLAEKERKKERKKEKVVTKLKFGMDR